MPDCSKPCNPTSLPDPIPLPSLPRALSTNKFNPSPSDVLAIQKTLSLYPICIDGQRFDKLSLIFAADATANYPGFPVPILSSLDSIASALENSLEKVTTQHALTTQVINVKANGKEAESVTYFSVNYFGTGDLEGEMAVTYGQYQDVWRKGKEGEWRVVWRNVVGMVSFSIAECGVEMR